MKLAGLIHVPFGLHRGGCQGEHACLNKNIDRKSVNSRSLTVLETPAFHSRRCSVPHIEFDPAVVQRLFRRALEQKHEASLKFTYQLNGLCYLVHR